MEGGELPSPREGLRTALVGNLLFVTGGEEDNHSDLTSILAWDQVTESWQPSGNLAVRRHFHAAVAISTSTIAMYCET